MLKGLIATLFALVVFSQLDQALYQGRSTDAAFKVLREIKHGFGF